MYAQQPQQQQQHGGHQKQPVRNTDPGVWEPEDEEDPRLVDTNPGCTIYIRTAQLGYETNLNSQECKEIYLNICLNTFPKNESFRSFPQVA